METTRRFSRFAARSSAGLAAAFISLALIGCGGGSESVETSGLIESAQKSVQSGSASALTLPASQTVTPDSMASTIGRRLAVSAVCPQITSWINRDVDFFPEVPALRVTRVDHDNTPSGRGYYLPSSEVRDVLATSFSMTASPTFTRDLRVSNNLRVELLSYASEAKAIEMFGRERAGFVKLNKEWLVAGEEPNSYLMLYVEGEPSRITDYPGEIQGMFLLRNTIAFLTLRSASTAEGMSSVGLGKLADRLVQARALVDGKCGGSVTNRAPTIELLPTQDRIFFQEAMTSRSALTGQPHPGISIKATDPDGRTDIDWSTFRISIAGVDQTGVALQVINRLAEEKRIQVVSTGTSEEYYFGMDPTKLMGSHNLLNISWNGNWPIRLRICDKRGACSQQDYTRYFGPFIDVWEFTDLHCFSSEQSYVQMSMDWGNNGYPAKTNFYIALAEAGKVNASPRWFLAFGQASPFNEFFWWEDWPSPHSLLPTAMPMATGDLGRASMFKVSSRVIRNGAVSGNFALPSATDFRLIYGALDIDQGSYYIATMAKDASTCL